MRAFAEAWPKRPFVQQVAAQLPWFHWCVLLDRLKDPAPEAAVLCRHRAEGRGAKA